MLDGTDEIRPAASRAQSVEAAMDVLRKRQIELCWALPLHHWSSHIIHRCHRCDPGSIHGCAVHHVGGFQVVRSHRHLKKYALRLLVPQAYHFWARAAPTTSGPLQRRPPQGQGTADHRWQPCWKAQGLLRELNPGPLAPWARIIPLDQAANAAGCIDLPFHISPPSPPLPPSPPPACNPDSIARRSQP